MNNKVVNTVLVVDDEPDICELIEITLGRMSINSISAMNVTEAKALLQKQVFDLVLTDMKLPDGTGIELVEHIQTRPTDTPVAVISAFGSMDKAISALKAGAFDFVSKPVELGRLRELINHALRLSSSPQEQITHDQPFKMLGDSQAIHLLQTRIKKLAKSQAPVYISGESGSGKELVARTIHSLGPRKEAPFIPVNCGAIPGELMESEFFGHKKGSFTGATSDKLGLFQAAHTGTLFLDEVADLPLHMQVKLLRAIQEKSIRPIGSQTEQPVDIRLLSATHKNLQQLVDKGHFRQDLFYRINVIQLDVPALRDRITDIPMLTQHFITKLANDWGIDAPSVNENALAALKQYTFPGNVRELENILERALTLCDDTTIDAEHLQLPTNENEEADKASLNSSPPLPTTPSMMTTATESATASPALTPKIEIDKIDSLEDYLTSIEKQVILSALEATRWNRTAAAKRLGMTFRALRYRLKKLGIEETQ